MWGGGGAGGLGADGGAGAGEDRVPPLPRRAGWMGERCGKHVVVVFVVGTSPMGHQGRMPPDQYSPTKSGVVDFEAKARPLEV